MKTKQVIQKEKYIELINDLLKQGFSRNQLLEQLNWNSRQLTTFCYRHNLKITRYNNIFPNEEQTQIIIGSLLGDGCVSYSGKYSKNCRLQISHCIKQYDYLLYKYNILKNLCNKNISVRNRTDNRFINPNYQQCEIKSKSLVVFTNYRKRWYDKEGKKNIRNMSNIYLIDSLALAIWYMDDGTKETSSYSIATQSFSTEDLIFLQNLLLKKFNLHTTVRKDKTLYIRKKSKEVFINLIKPHIINSMLYKI